MVGCGKIGWLLRSINHFEATLDKIENNSICSCVLGDDNVVNGWKYYFLTKENLRCLQRGDLFRREKAINIIPNLQRIDRLSVNLRCK